MRDDSVEAVNAVLAAVQPYAAQSDLRKDAYGAKLKDLLDQYAHYVPLELVPDRFELPSGDRTRAFDAWKQTTLSYHDSTEATVRSAQAASVLQAQPSAASARETPRKVRWLVWNQR